MATVAGVGGVAGVGAGCGVTEEDLAKRLEESFRGLGLSEAQAATAARRGRPAEMSPASESLSAEGRRQYELGRSLGLSEAQSLAWVPDLGLDRETAPGADAGGGDLAAAILAFEDFFVEAGYPRHLVEEASRRWHAGVLAEAYAKRAERHRAAAAAPARRKAAPAGRKAAPARSSKATISEIGELAKVVR